MFLSARQILLIGVTLFATGMMMGQVFAQTDDAAVDEEYTTFEPQLERSEADEDRMLASTLFAHGRLLFRRERFEEALQQYQSAYRFSNGSSTILSEIVPLAFRLGRGDEAARYALRANEDCRLDPFVLRRLALYLTENERFEDALGLYEQTTRIPEDEDLEGAAIITQFELARLYFLTEDYENAAKAFDEVAHVIDQAGQNKVDAAAIDALLKQPSVTYSVMAESYLLANRLEDAKTYFTRAQGDKPDNELLAFHLARLAEKREDYEEASQQLQIYLNAKKDDAGTSPYELLARLLEKQNKSDELIPRLEKLVEQQADNLYLNYFLAQQYLDAKDFNKAAKRYQELLEQQATLDAYRGLAESYSALNDDEKLLDLLSRAATDLGNLTSIQSGIEDLLKDHQRLDSLFATARKRIGAQPHDEQRPTALAGALLAAAAKRFDVADEFFQLAAGEPPNADAAIWMAWGLEMLLADRGDRAIEIFQTMIDKKIGRRQRGEVLYYLSGALALNKEFDKALSAAEQAARLSRRIPAIQLRPAWVHYLAEHWEEADQAYREFLEDYDDGQSPAVREAVREAKMTLSNVSIYRENYEQAMEWLEQILDEYPDDVGALNDLGYLWADQGIHLERALRMARKALEAEPENIAYLDSVGWALYRLGRYDQAVQELQKAASADEPDPIILDHLGDALRQLGDVAQARKVWQRALALLQDDQDKQKKTIQSKLEQFISE